MQKVFYSLSELDKKAEAEFEMKDGILMENAARGMAERIKELFLQQGNDFENRVGLHCKAFYGRGEQKGNGRSFYGTKNKGGKLHLQIICGSGDNGGDGLALARMLFDYFTVTVICPKQPKSELCILQMRRLKKLSIPIKKTLNLECDILVDAFLGTGLKGELKLEDKNLIEKINTIDAFTIACDIPSGLNLNGNASPVAVRSDMTFSMGALKKAFFSDEAKDITGKIEVIDLGVPRRVYEDKTDIFLLEENDLHLPLRSIQNTHKKTFGHAGIICGEKKGAAFLAAEAALRFGAGVITICSKDELPVPFNYMYSKIFLTEEFTAAAIGPGLGKTNYDYALAILSGKKNEDLPLILDADIFYAVKIKEVLPRLKKAILTPHPKEFAALLQNCSLGSFSVTEIQKDRFKFVKLFCEKYPALTLLLKGTHVLIGQNKNIFINPLGTPSLSKAGSGDVLTGMITALSAQGFAPLEAAVSASLAHSLAGKEGSFFKRNYSLTASILIENLDRL